MMNLQTPLPAEGASAPKTPTDFVDPATLVPLPPALPFDTVMPGRSSSSTALDVVPMAADPAAIMPRGIELLDAPPPAVTGEQTAGVHAVTLQTAPVGPPKLPASWPWMLGLGLIIIAGLMLGSVLVWSRVGGAWAGGVVLGARRLRSISELRGVRAVARAAGEPVVAVLVSQHTFERGARAIIEAKGPVPVKVISGIESARRRVFA